MWLTTSSPITGRTSKVRLWRTLVKPFGVGDVLAYEPVTTAGGGISTIILATREVKPLVAGPVSVLVAGHKSGDVYYTRRTPGGQSGGATVCATNVDTGATREVVKLPPGRSVASLNADETLLLGTYVDGAAPPTPNETPFPHSEQRARFTLPLPGIGAPAPLPALSAFVAETFLRARASP